MMILLLFEGLGIKLALVVIMTESKVSTLVYFGQMMSPKYLLSDEVARPGPKPKPATRVVPDQVTQRY